MNIALPKSQSERLDYLGAFAGSLCAAHCALSALLPAAFGALGLGVLLGHEAEWAFTAVAVAFASGALALYWKRGTGAIDVPILLLLGVAGLLASRLVEASGASHGLGAVIGVLAGLLVLAGHLRNLRATCV